MRPGAEYYDGGICCPGLEVGKNDAGEVGFRVFVGGGMGRTPIIGTLVSRSGFIDAATSGSPDAPLPAACPGPRRHACSSSFQ